MTPEDYIRQMLGDLMLQLAIVKAERDALKVQLTPQEKVPLPNPVPEIERR
jgi:hypothetical protein